MTGSKPLSSSTSSSSSLSRPSTSGSAEVPPSSFYFPSRLYPATSDEVVREPYGMPYQSVPATSKPASVVSYSGFADQPVYRRRDSRVSVQSAQHKESGDLQETNDAPSNSLSSGRTHARNSSMAPRPIRESGGTGRAKPSSPLSIVSRVKEPMRSTMLTSAMEKPWLVEKDRWQAISHWVVCIFAVLGIAGGAVRVFFTWKQTLHLGNLCLVMEDNFDTFDTENTWTREVSMGGFGNDEFEMMTDFDNNSFVRDGHLYIVPTLTSDAIGRDAVLGSPPFTYNLTGCTDAKDPTNCGAVSDASLQAVIPPVMSARIHTRGHHSIKYGRVEIRAKLPRGDWLWPAMWMLPVNDTYGPWPRSGEIDIMEARGNGPEYKAQGVDYVRGSLNWGPFPWLNGVGRTFWWWMFRRKTFADDFHTYALEWNAEFLRIFVDSRLTYMLYLKFDKPFFGRGDFPSVVANGSTFLPLEDPWKNGTKNAAPFDQPFYLIMDVAVGGTNGWFPDNAGGKPWFDGSETAMTEFARAQSQWTQSWPKKPEDRALVVDSVKMWQLC